MKLYVYKIFLSLILVLTALPAFALRLIVLAGGYPESYVPKVGLLIVAYFILAILSLVFKLPIMYWFGLRSRRGISAVVIANLVSIPAYNVLSNSTFSPVDVLLILVEFAIIKFLVKNMSWKRLLVAVIVANLFPIIVLNL